MSTRRKARCRFVDPLLCFHVNSTPYGAELDRLVSRAGLRTASPTEVVSLVVEWLEDESDPFGEGWNRLLQESLIWHQGDLMDDAPSASWLFVSLLDALEGRRLAWVLADLDSTHLFLTGRFLRSVSADQLARAEAVRDELLNAGPACLRALQDGDPRARGFAVSLLAQSHPRRQGTEPSWGTAARGALAREADPVAAATMHLAISSDNGFGSGILPSLIAGDPGFLSAAEQKCFRRSIGLAPSVKCGASATLVYR